MTSKNPDSPRQMKLLSAREAIVPGEEVAGSSPVRVAKVLVSYLFKADIRTLFGLVAQLVRAND